MIKIRNESDLKNWFKKNYKKLGFSKIIRQDIGVFPDFIMEKNGREIRVELEVKTSNFILHKHSKNDVDIVVCLEEDIKLDLSTITLNNFKIVNRKSNSPYSLKSQITRLFEKEKVLTNGEVAKALDIHPSTAQRALMELAIEGKITRKKTKTRREMWIKQ